MKVMKVVFVATVSLTALLATACVSPAVKSPSSITPTQSQPSEAFHAPTLILAPTVADDSPGQSWNFPNDPAKVIQSVDAWLSMATVTTVHLPKPDKNLHFMDYIGPSELSFTDEHGDRITVAPAFYIAHGSRGYYPSLIKNVVSYENGNRVTYLKCPQLFNWLGNDAQWESEFRMESYTDADGHAITDAKKSKWGGNFTNIFPAIPGIDKRDIRRGGPAPAKGSTGTVPGTVETLVDQSGVNRKVTFIEVWDNGKGQHRWTYVASPSGAVTSHTESGDTPPQDWM